jgi:hypothetical protein
MSIFTVEEFNKTFDQKIQGTEETVVVKTKEKDGSITYRLFYKCGDIYSCKHYQNLPLGKEYNIPTRSLF